MKELKPVIVVGLSLLMHRIIYSDPVGDLLSLIETPEKIFVFLMLVIGLWVSIPVD